MSAIGGVVADDGGTLDPALASRLIAATPVRGFDGTDVWQDGPAVLIRHHHATTPQAVGETQPLLSSDGRHVLLLDGRIDNRADVIALLARPDCGEATPDAALVLAAFERFGEDCITRLVGDWALAVWDTAQRSLFLARSPAGWRPLVWSHTAGRFGFATDARTLLRGLALDHAPDEGVIGEILAMHVVTQIGSPWRSVRQLEQGGALRIVGGSIRRWHWHVVPDGIDETLSDVDHIDRFTALFDQAIVATTRSQTTVSAQLSGGLDSSSVVTRAIELHRAGAIARPVQAISSRFPGQAQDETAWSRAVEDRLGIVARVTGADAYTFADAHRWSAETYQFPIRPNVFDTYTAALRLQRDEDSRVLLTGEGGDEWMGSGVAHLADLLRQRRPGALLREGLRQYPGDPVWKRLARTAYWALMPQVSRHHRRRIAFSNLGERVDTVPDWITPDWARTTHLSDRLRHAMPTATFASFAQQQRYSNYDMAPRFLGFGNILALAERHGVELRHPFYDLRLTHFFMTAAPRMLKRDGVRKILLREAMRDHLPDIVRTRLDKARFVESIADAVVERLRQRPVETLLPVALGWLDRERVAAMAEQVRRTRDHSTGQGLILLGPLWYIISLDVWLTEATGGWAA